MRALDPAYPFNKLKEALHFNAYPRPTLKTNVFFIHTGFQKENTRHLPTDNGTITSNNVNSEVCVEKGAFSEATF